MEGGSSTLGRGVDVIAVERDMNPQQCLMVDQCFEEGQYESGIDALDQMRTTQVRPSPAHIRQLIYIALCRAPASYQTNQEKGKAKASSEDVPFGSPTKTARKANKTSFRPSAKASEAARRLLSSYALTNLPESLIRAIPCYKFTDSEGEILPRPIDMTIKSVRTEEDSVIAQKSITLLDYPSCWHLLKPGLVSGGNASSWTLQASGRVEEDAYQEVPEETESIIGDTAWPLLTWLVDLFEKDESLVKDESQGRYSALLFSQIKPSDGSTQRSNAEAPLQVALACYEQTDIHRQYLGQRLMRLLVNLTSCSLFSALPLLSSLSNHLDSFSPETLSKFLSELPTTSRGIAFKAALCDKTLGLTLGAVQQTHARKARTAQPRAVDGPVGSPSKAAPRSALQKSFAFPVPTATKIMEVLSSFQKNTKASKGDFIVLFHLVVAVGNLASEQEVQSDGDRVWSTLVLDGQLQRAIAETFVDKSREPVENNASTEIDKMGAILKMKCDVWRSACIS